jgi:hypothetical protein
VTNEGDLAKVGDVFRRCPADIRHASEQQNEDRPVEKNREPIALYKAATTPGLA